MDKQWRPSDWDVLDIYAAQSGLATATDFIEAGADAMLGGLKENACILTGDSVIPASGDYPEIHVPTGMKGWLAYIPDEEAAVEPLIEEQ